MLLLAVLAGCVPPTDSSSNTTVDPNLSGPLLSEAEVRGIDGLLHLEAEELTELATYENPDPRGPCGAVVSQPPIRDALGRGFTALTLSVIELVVLSTETSRAYLDAVLADGVDGCGEFTSTTNRGQTQTVSEITFVDASDLPESALAWMSRVDVADRAAFIGAGIFEANGYVVVIQMQSNFPIPLPQLQQVVQKAADRINAQ